VASVSSISLLNQHQIDWQNRIKQQQQDFSQLGAALQSGDLSSAQTAFSDLLQFTSTTSQNPNSLQSAGSGIQADLSAIGNDLQSGDMTSAQTEYSKLQQDLQAAHTHAHGHHHHHQQQSTDADSTSASNSLTDLLQSAYGNSASNALLTDNSGVNITA